MECVRALLDRGAAIDQAKVGFPNLDGRVLRGLYVCGDVREAPCMHV